MEELTLKVFAKINLKLDITGVLEDGYHSLDMVNTSIDVYDLIKATKATENEVYMDGVLQDDANTAYKALEVLSLAYGYKMKVEIEKHIPFSAGVGGSSADAAGVFVAYSRLYGVELEYMNKLALSIGSDVVYMLKGGPAKVKCKGEIIFPIENFDGLNLVLLQKITGAPTAQVYKKYDLMGRSIEGAFKVNDVDVFNVLQAPAITLCREIRFTIDELRKYTDRVFMTGSGSAVCGVFDTYEQAKACVDKIEGDYVFKNVVKTLPAGIEIISEM